MAQIFISPDVQHVRDLHPYLADPAFRKHPIRSQLTHQAQTLGAAFEARDERVAMQVLSWWPKAQNRTLAQVFATAFDPQDALETVAREYGFGGAGAIAQLGDLELDLAFEAALDHALAGDLDQLAASLADQPGLATARTRFGHRATLLHYLAANGVESHRQVVPENAVDVAKLLRANGAQASAEAQIYGGGQTAQMLARSSAHPHAAGIADALSAALDPSMGETG